MKTTTTSMSSLNEQELDPLSSFPDVILAEILSRLPTKIAVSTSVLSHRWRTLWTQVTSIDIDYRHFRHNSPELYTIVDHCLSHLTSLCIRSFCLRLPDPQRVPLNPVIESWLRHICARNVERIELTTEGYRSGIIPFAIPHCIFETPSLAVLDLFTSLDYNLPADTDLINLPNLEILCLNVGAAQCGFVSKMINSCPSLQELHLYESGSSDLITDKSGCTYVIDISCPSLKMMQLMFVRATASIKFVIDAPRLTTFALYATLLTCSFVKKPIALREAIIFTSEAVLLSLLPVISNVSILQTAPFTISRLEGVDDENLIFPNLMDLTLHLSSIDDPTTDDILDQFLVSPRACLLQHVKRIKLCVCDFEHGKHVLNMAKYMLTNAPALEWLVLCVIAERQSECTFDYLCEEMAFCKQLSEYPRSSPGCQIEFSGRYVKLPAGLKEKSDLMLAFSSALDHISASFTART